MSLLVAAFESGCAGGGTEEPDLGSREEVSIRKQVYDLRPADLERFPIWEHALDEEGVPGQDEATVKPRPDLSHADPTAGEFIVRAGFVAKDTTRFDGYCYASDEDHPGLIQPTIVTEDGQVNFWYGAFAPKRGALERQYQLLGKTAQELFPIRYRALVPARGVKLEGVITAFSHYESPESQRIVGAK
jgi:hypothetical protein